MYFISKSFTVINSARYANVSDMLPTFSVNCKSLKENCTYKHSVIALNFQANYALETSVSFNRVLSVVFFVLIVLLKIFL